jgi:hypothetical protein
MIANGLQFEPFANHRSRLADGYLFRSPHIKPTEWQDVIASFENFTSVFSLVIRPNEGDIDKVGAYALLRIQDQQDAAMFAWSNLENWQKWSDSAEKQEAEDKKQKAKVKVDKDGKVTATVTVTTLGD